MKKTAVLMAVLLCALSLLCPGCSSGSESGGLVLRVNPFPDCEQTMITCNETASGSYCLFLPSDADRAALYVEYDGADLRCGGEKLPNGTVTDLLASAEELTLTRGRESYSLLVLQSESLPSIYISSEKDVSWLHQDRSNKSPGDIVIVDNGTVVTQTSLKHIKGRGNSTWAMGEWKEGVDKRPYNIKLNEAQSLLGMPSAKKWRLLANTLDRYFIRNQLGLYCGREMGLECALDCRPADLYINGDYRGSYLLTQSIDAGEGYIPINDTQELNKQANEPVELESFAWQNETGIYGLVTAQWRDLPKSHTQNQWAFLVELISGNMWGEEFSSFLTKKTNWFEIKNPEDASKEQVRYISALFDRAEAALYARDGYGEDGRYYVELVDQDSVARALLVYELMMNSVASNESVFFYVPQGSETIYAGPVWDFDRTVVNEGAENWYLCDGSMSVTWFSAAFRHEDFRQTAAALWSAFMQTHTPQTLRDEAISFSRNITASVVMDQYRWGEQNSTPEATAEAYTRLCAGYAQTFAQRAVWLNTALSEESAYLWFEAEEGQFYMYPAALTVGEAFTVPTGEEEFLQISPFVELYFFDDDLLGWSTQPDGSGQLYVPGDSLPLTQKATTLYAVWR